MSADGLKRAGRKAARARIASGNPVNRKPNGQDAAPSLTSASPETIAAQAGGAVDAGTGAIVPPIHVATTFVRDEDNQYRRGYCYGRSDNATVRQVEHVMAQLEQGAASLLFASGMAAATTAFLALDRPAHVVAPTAMYWGLLNWLTEDAAGHGIEASFVDAGDPAALAAAVRPGRTRLVWIETPSNPLWSITDIAGAARIAHAAGALLAVDSTVPTPVLTRPLTLGADLVLHSATKYLNGHSDVVAGAIVFVRAGLVLESAARLRTLLGSVLGPFEAALLLRGLRTLHVRVRHQCASAMTIAQHFARHPGIARVLYPGLADHPGHAIAARQMTAGFGGMLSMRMAGGERGAIAAAARMKLWKRATSLGGVESLVEHRSSIEGAGSPCPPDLLRFSVGLEDVADLVADIEAALAAEKRRNAPARQRDPGNGAHQAAVARAAGQRKPAVNLRRQSAVQTVAVAIFCKTPIAGLSKTRLSPPLGAAECAVLSACFIRDLAATIDGVARAGRAVPYAVYTPLGSEHALRALLPAGFRLLPQCDGEFGARLLHAATGLLRAGHAGAILVNADSPTLPASILGAAVRALGAGEDRVVLSPAFDGGYTLIGLSRPHARLFADIPWSTPQVHRLTVERAAEIGVPVVEVPGWYDVDDGQTLRMLESELAGGSPAFAEPGLVGAPAPATRRFLQQRHAPAEARIA